MHDGIMRNRLVELLACKFPNMRLQDAYTIADHLLAEGVIAPPCKVGDTVYLTIAEKGCGVMEAIITGHIIITRDGEVLFDLIVSKSDSKIWTIGTYLWPGTVHIGKTVFLTREEAEKALAEREGNG